jgi:hypothetical protein
MKLLTSIHWKTFVACLVASLLFALSMQKLAGFGFWASWGIVLIGWVGVGVTTFFDDD